MNWLLRKHRGLTVCRQNPQRKDLPFCPKLAWSGKTDSSASAAWAGVPERNVV